MASPIANTDGLIAIRGRGTTLNLTYVVQIVGVAASYTLAALAGLRLDAVSGFASLIWAPTGISIAAVLLLGHRIWPGIFLGALAANVINGAAVPVAMGIGTGNTLEALAAALALRRVPGLRMALDGLRDTVAFIAIAVLLAPIISASIGVATLKMFGLVAPHRVTETWRTWWVGDAIGALLVAPLILVWCTQPRSRLTPARLAEAAALLLGLLLASVAIFLLPLAAESARLGQAYVFFPLLMWGAIRFGQRGAVTASAIVAAIAIAGTVMSQGPFTQATTHENLFALQAFIGITVSTILVLGASASERERSREQLRIGHEVVTAANRAKAEFLAVMSHELRTPLNAIAGYSELLSLGVPGDLTDKQRDAVDRIRKNQQHLLSLIDDVLSFARVEAGKHEITPRPLRLCEALDSLEPLVRPDLARRQITFVWKGCDPTLTVVADPVKLRQLLLNVIGNAIKFTPHHGKVEVSVGRGADHALIRVADSGIGIPTDKLDQIFEPFFQVHTGTTREYSGVGLGLAISRDFARAMGGDVTVESTSGKGTVVSIQLPMHPVGTPGPPG